MNPNTNEETVNTNGGATPEVDTVDTTETNPAIDEATPVVPEADATVEDSPVEDPEQHAADVKANMEVNGLADAPEAEAAEDKGDVA